MNSFTITVKLRVKIKTLTVKLRRVKLRNLRVKLLILMSGLAN